MCLVYLQPKPRFPGRVGAALMSVGKRSHGKVIERQKNSVTYRTSTGAHRTRGTCWASLSLQGTRMVTGCLSASHETASPGTPYSTNTIMRMLYLISRWAGRTRRTDGTYIALNNWKIRKWYILHQNTTMLTPLF